jgi:single stranded DNA-binding protein
MINATILGRLGRDPELRTTNSGTQVLSLNLATNSGYGDNRITMWIRCSIFGARAERLSGMLTKGSQVVVSGELTQREYTTTAGEARTSLELRVSELEFAGPKSDAQESAPASAPARARKPARRQEPEIHFEEHDMKDLHGFSTRQLTQFMENQSACNFAARAITMGCALIGCRMAACCGRPIPASDCWTLDAA